MRKRPVFLIRIPELVLGIMFMKAISFGLTSWMFLDTSCPCLLVTFICLTDNAGNYYNVMRKVVLLFRYELQAALESFKLQGNIGAMDNTNIYVRYRYILRTKWQYLLMGIVFAILAVGRITVLLVYMHEVTESQYCIRTHFADNDFLLWNMVLQWVEFVPMMSISVWSTRRLKAFPKDNWKMGAESSITSAIAGIIGISLLFTMLFQPFLDKFLFLLFAISPLLQILSFLVPLQFHRESVLQFAQMELKQLTSLERLLHNATFVDAFDGFLKKEFSSENLFFWLEAHKIQRKYKLLLPADLVESRTSSKSGSSGPPKVRMEEVDVKSIIAAAKECTALGLQCIGDEAPWQINISGDADEAIEAAMAQISQFFAREYTDKEVEGELRILVEDVLRALLRAQEEIYEALRKDSYPRFLLSPACAELNKNEHLKRLLATEKLDDEVRGTNSSSAPTRKSEPSPPPGGTTETTKGRISMAALAPVSSWNKHLSQMRNVARKETLELPTRGSRAESSNRSMSEAGGSKQSGSDDDDVPPSRIEMAASLSDAKDPSSDTASFVSPTPNTTAIDIAPITILTLSIDSSSTNGPTSNTPIYNAPPSPRSTRY